jgi:hypothetical protein
LSPLHLNYNPPGITDEEALRDAKIAWAHKEFMAGRNQIRFMHFKSIFGEILHGNECPTDSDLYVQYLCYSQLFEAFQVFLRHGIALISDVSMHLHPEKLRFIIPVFSLFSNAIYVTDSIKLSVSQFPLWFGREGAKFILNSYFTRMDKGVVFNRGGHRRLMDTIVYFDADWREHIQAVIEDLSNKKLIPFEAPLSPTFVEALGKCHSQRSAAIIIDDALAEDPKFAKIVSKFDFVVASERSTEVTAYSLAPRNLKWRKNVITEDLKGRMARNVFACEIGIEEFVFAAGLNCHTFPTNANRLCFTVEELRSTANFALLNAFLASLEPANRDGASQS